MNRLLSRKLLVLIAVISAFAALIVGGSALLVAAQGETTPTATPSTTPTTTTKARCVMPNTQGKGPLSNLLNELVQNNIISQQQATQIQQFIANRAQQQCAQRLILPEAEILSTVAQKTGLTVDQLLLELRNGQTLAAVAQAHGISQDQLKSALLDVAKTNANTLVQQGVLTQDVANSALNALSQRLDTLLTQQWHGRYGAGFPNFGRGHGWGHHKGAQPSTNPTPTPSSGSSV